MYLLIIYFYSLVVLGVYPGVYFTGQKWISTPNQYMISDLVVVFFRGARTDKKVEKEEKTILMTVSTGGWITIYVLIQDEYIKLYNHVQRKVANAPSKTIALITFFL